jgi:hypothetical protein
MQPFGEPHERERERERERRWEAYGGERRVLLSNSLNPLVSNSPPRGPFIYIGGGRRHPPFN